MAKYVKKGRKPAGPCMAPNRLVTICRKSRKKSGPRNKRKDSGKKRGKTQKTVRKNFAKVLSALKAGNMLKQAKADGVFPTLPGLN